MMESATVLISQHVRSLMKHSGGISKDIAPTHTAFLKWEVLGKSKKLYVKKKKIVCKVRTVSKQAKETSGLLKFSFNNRIATHIDE